MEQYEDFIVTSWNKLSTLKELLIEDILRFSVELQPVFMVYYGYIDELRNKINPEYIEALLNFRSSVNDTVAIMASYKGNIEMVKYLFFIGVNRDLVNDHGSNCLLAAAFKGHLELVKYLMMMYNGITDEHGYDVMLAAVSSSNLALVDYLIGIGISTSTETIFGNNCLLLAAYEGSLELVIKMINIGINLHSKNNGGNNCLLLAVFQGHLELVKYLISMGMDKNSTNIYGNNCLIFAASQGHLELVKYLLSIGADKNWKNNRGYNCLLIAAIYGQLEIVKYLISTGMCIVSNDIFSVTNDKKIKEYYLHLVTKTNELDVHCMVCMDTKSSDIYRCHYGHFIHYHCMIHKILANNIIDFTCDQCKMPMYRIS